MDYDLRVCTWNIRMRWIGQGCKSQAHCDIYYSCHAERREFGCGFVVDRRLRHLVSGFTLVNQRLAKILIKAKFHNISLICAHAATEEKDNAVKDAFYANLEVRCECQREGRVRMYLWSHSTSTKPLGCLVIDQPATRLITL